MPSFFLFVLLLRFRRANRADVRAVAAVDALIGVDYVNAGAFADRFHGALGSASAAADALFGNLICHVTFLRKLKFVNIITQR